MFLADCPAIVAGLLCLQGCDCCLIVQLPSHNCRSHCSTTTETIMRRCSEGGGGRLISPHPVVRYITPDNDCSKARYFGTTTLAQPTAHVLVICPNSASCRAQSHILVYHSVVKQGSQGSWQSGSVYSCSFEGNPCWNYF